MHRTAAVCAILVAALSTTLPARADAPTILVDGMVARTDVPPIIVDGHVLVPLRGVFERFGADVDFDAAKNIAVARRDGIVVRVAVGTSDAWVGGTHVTLETPAREFAGRVEVPLRFVAEALGVAVDYDASTNTIVVVSGLRSGNFVASGPGTPSFSTASASYTTTVSQAIAPSVDERRPAPNSLVGSRYPQIYARLDGGTSAVDPGTVRVLLDRADITDSSTVSSAYVAYTPAAALGDGTHSVDISGQSDDGTPFDDQWSFQIESDVSSDYVSSVIGYSPSSFGYRRFGFSPPGFSVFAPGPQFFFIGQPIVIVFFSPFFPSGNGFFTFSGFPGQFAMTPWLGCPGFFWGALNVPFGVNASNAVAIAHFTTSDGRNVVVHGTAPIHIDGTRRSMPSNVRFAVRAHLVDRPTTPRALVAFARVVPVARTMPIARVGGPVGRPIPIGSRPVARPMPIVRSVAPVIIPRAVPVIVPRVVMPAPAPVQIPVAPIVIPPAPQPVPLPVVIPKKPPA
jgi:hypothetical protein